MNNKTFQNCDGQLNSSASTSTTNINNNNKINAENIEKPESSLKILHWNCNSIKSKIGNLLNFIYEKNRYNSIK